LAGGGVNPAGLPAALVVIGGRWSETDRPGFAPALVVIGGRWPVVEGGDSGLEVDGDAA
jgi:hypothetical protein